MKSLILESGKNLIYQVDAVSEEFNSIIEPLFQELPFSYFGYHKFFRNGYYMTLSSNPQFTRSWLDYYIANDLSNDTDKKLFLSSDKKRFVEQINAVPKNSIYKYLWPIHDKKQMPGLPICNKFNMDFGITLICNTKDYLESFMFAAPIGCEQVTDIYLNYYHFLEKFVIYFKNKAYHLINSTDKNKMAFSPFVQEGLLKDIDNLDVDRNFIWNKKKFFEDTQISKIPFNTQSKNLFGKFDC